MLPNRHHDVLPVGILIENPVPVHPARLDILQLIDNDESFNGVNDLELPDIRKEIWLHQTHLHL